MVESGRSGSYRPDMTVSLLNVGSRLSLEFDTSDLDTVRSYIEGCYAEVRTKAAGIATIVIFGGEDFTFQNEWDDPCLISQSATGDDLLRALHAHLCRG